ncbi:LysR family transcriptional regulator [Bordetella ansorpii]|uniref:LysR family transcriptional regulator n=1 Tax=Bordetella ansorpii TaxID=288768 RepID=A0A157SIL8_9BORD|nr:LysR substrate-binding domain-containing protein [Bordetella ansorpii]SAI70298.1 LysR family transcriptional regulator [Bordetella ansorpii]
MRLSNTGLLARLPSLRSLLVFNVAGKHLNLVRASEELFQTQGALSRQLKALEDHVGFALFERGPRGLRFTQEGELLYDFTCRAFDLLGTGLNRLMLDVERQTLVVSAARSFSLRNLAVRLPEFIAAHPWIDLRIDVHRFYADLESSGVDISIRLGTGDWPHYHVLRLTDDVIVPVCTPAVARCLQEAEGSGGAAGPPAQPAFLRNTERDYLDLWNQDDRRRLQPDDGPSLNFNDSATLLGVLEAGMGVTLIRSSLVDAALQCGTLVQPYPGQVRDGLNYHAVCAPRSSDKPAVMLFLQWLRQVYPAHAVVG